MTLLGCFQHHSHAAVVGFMFALYSRRYLLRIYCGILWEKVFSFFLKLTFRLETLIWGEEGGLGVAGEVK